MTESQDNEIDDFDKMMDEGFAEVSAPEPEPEPEKTEDEAGEVEELEEAEADEEPEEEPVKADEKPLPKGKRAREEYEARVRLQIENDNLRESLKAITRPRDEAKPDAIQTDDDYLQAKGVDPDAFIDDAAKAAVLMNMRNFDKLQAEVSKNSQQNEDLQYSNYVSNTVNRLPEAAKADLGAAFNHLINTEARSIALDYPKASVEECREAASRSLDAAMLSKYKAGVNPMEWGYKLAQARDYKPASMALTKPKESSKLDVKRIAESQQRAGSPNINKVQTSPVGDLSDWGGDAYLKDIGLKK